MFINYIISEMRVSMYIRIFIKMGAYEGKSSNVFLVLAVYNYEGFQRDKKNRKGGFKRHMERKGFSILRSISN
jgi:hypothetical protein